MHPPLHTPNEVEGMDGKSGIMAGDWHASSSSRTSSPHHASPLPSNTHITTTTTEPENRSFPSSPPALSTSVSLPSIASQGLLPHASLPPPALLSEMSFGYLPQLNPYSVLPQGWMLPAGMPMLTPFMANSDTHGQPPMPLSMPYGMHGYPPTFPSVVGYPSYSLHGPIVPSLPMPNVVGPPHPAMDPMTPLETHPGNEVPASTRRPSHKYAPYPVNTPIPYPSSQRPHSAILPDAPPDQTLKSRLPRKYLCTFPGCEKRFTTSGHLSRHVRTHTGERRYLCPYDGCGARFSRQDNMMQHFRTHPGCRGLGRRGGEGDEAQESGNHEMKPEEQKRDGSEEGMPRMTDLVNAALQVLS